MNEHRKYTVEEQQKLLTANRKKYCDDREDFSHLVFLNDRRTIVFFYSTGETDNRGKEMFKTESIYNI